jgi:hypothetical protein
VDLMVVLEAEVHLIVILLPIRLLTRQDFSRATDL